MKKENSIYKKKRKKMRKKKQRCEVVDCFI